MKKLISIILIISTVFLFGCESINQVYGKIYDVRVIAEDFCLALSDDNIELAQTYLHPDSSLNNDFGDFIAKLEGENDFDFSEGVAFLFRGEASAALYSFQYDGSPYELEYNLVIGKKEICLLFVVINNQNGWGIYDVQSAS